MIYKPPKFLGLLIGIILFSFLLGGIIFAILQISSGEINTLLGLWVSIVVIGSPLLLMVIYRLYGLITARYILDRNGFYLRWGFSVEQIPIASIEKMIMGNEMKTHTKPPLGFYWPGCIVGGKKIEGFKLAEFYASRPTKEQIIIPLEERSLIISPPDVETFHQTFLEMVHLGSLERIPPISIRPDFFSARLWADRAARILILSGLALNVCLLGYLGFRAAQLPESVPFGFDSAGTPNTFVPPSQLLLLPLVGGFFWLANLAVGVWLYRSERDRQIAYVVWFTGTLLGGLLWGASLHLLSAI